MSKYTIINFICLLLILFADLGLSIDIMLLGVQLIMSVLHYKEYKHE